jgi:GT2 family glycosyltransferase
LCAAAKGEIIVHFDDDDFYGPRYIEQMVSFMDDLNADFVKLFGFFLYDRTREIFAYWDLERDFPLHFLLSPIQQEFGWFLNNDSRSGKWGYGFSYAFRRTVWEAVNFPDRDHGEDQEFANAVIKSFKPAGMQDFGRSCLHIIHTGNSSKAFPQQRLPTECLPSLFPGFPNHK